MAENLGKNYSGILITSQASNILVKHPVKCTAS